MNVDILNLINLKLRFIRTRLEWKNTDKDQLSQYLATKLKAQSCPSQLTKHGTSSNTSTLRSSSPERSLPPHSHLEAPAKLTLFSKLSTLMEPSGSWESMRLVSSNIQSAIKSFPLNLLTKSPAFKDRLCWEQWLMITLLSLSGSLISPTMLMPTWSLTKSTRSSSSSLSSRRTSPLNEWVP